MRITSDDVRFYIRRLYFTERLSFEQIADKLGLAVRTVRGAIVIDGGARPASPARTPGPFHQESDA